LISDYEKNAYKSYIKNNNQQEGFRTDLYNVLGPLKYYVYILYVELRGLIKAIPGIVVIVIYFIRYVGYNLIEFIIRPFKLLYKLFFMIISIFRGISIYNEITVAIRAVNVSLEKQKNLKQKRRGNLIMTIKNDIESNKQSLKRFSVRYNLEYKPIILNF
jgi:hypothetical protein